MFPIFADFLSTLRGGRGREVWTGGICSLPAGPVRQGKKSGSRRRTGTAGSSWPRTLQAGRYGKDSRAGQYRREVRSVWGEGGGAYIITSWSHHNRQPVKQQRRYLFKALSPLMYWNMPGFFKTYWVYPVWLKSRATLEKAGHFRKMPGFFFKRLKLDQLKKSRAFS